MYRRDFLVRTGLALGGALAGGQLAGPRAAAAAPGEPLKLDDWAAVRAQFNLSHEHANFAGFFLASHPKPVREAIEAHRRGFDDNAVRYFFDNVARCEGGVLQAAAEYLGTSGEDIALTDSTTMGLGLLYGGLKLRPGQDVLSTLHDHYSTDQSLKLRAARTSATVRQIALYQKPAAASVDEIVGSIVRALKPRTRILALTWVHSCTGVKLPIRAIADALAPINAKRAEADRVLLCVDGVHGLAVDDVTLPDLGCDFFIAGTHKWLCGPRGTGLVWGKPSAWPAATATIPTFYGPAYFMWEKEIPPAPIPFGAAMSPGGFHSFEHRWALAEAFKFHQRMGKARVAARIYALNRQLKEGLRAMKHVTLHTPMDEKLSAGMVCFDVQGMKPRLVAERLWARKVIATETPYAVKYARLAASLWNSEPEVERALREIRALA